MKNLVRTPKHLPVRDWPEADREAFRVAYEPGDIFDEPLDPGLTIPKELGR